MVIRELKIQSYSHKNKAFTGLIFNSTPFNLIVVIAEEGPDSIIGGTTKGGASRR
jgi:hypothetical protein